MLLTNYDDGYNLYRIIRDESTGNVWYNSGKVLEAWGTSGRDASWYGVELDALGGRLHGIEISSDLPAGRYRADFYVRTGEEPNLTNDGYVESQRFIWDGSAEKHIIDTSGRVDVGAVAGDSSLGKYYHAIQLATLTAGEYVQAGGYGIGVLESLTGTNMQTGDIVEVVGASHTNYAAISAFYDTGEDNWVICLDRPLSFAVESDDTINVYTASNHAWPWGARYSDMQYNSDTIGEKLASVESGVKTAIEAAGSYLDFLKNVAEGDAMIDTTSTPWQLVIKKKGTLTELIRKDIKDVSGNNISAVTTVIGQQTEPA